MALADHDPDVLRTTRESLHRVTVHVVARARVQAAGRFSLRVAPGGFGTPELGGTARRVRISGAVLLVEDDTPGAAAATALPLDGASLADAAAFAGVDLTAPLDVGHDTFAVGDPSTALRVDADAAAFLADWLHQTVGALDRLIASLPSDAAPTLPRLWPEHFDVAIDAAARSGVRANIGGSVGDGYHAAPYLYVGPFTADRPGGGDYWNAPFGALRSSADIQNGDDALAFFREGVERLGGV